MSRLFACLALVCLSSLCVPASANEPPGFESIDALAYLLGDGVTRNDAMGYLWLKVAPEFNYAPWREAKPGLN